MRDPHQSLCAPVLAVGPIHWACDWIEPHVAVESQGCTSGPSVSRMVDDIAIVWHRFHMNHCVPMRCVHARVDLMTPAPRTPLGADNSLERAATGLARMTSLYNVTGAGGAPPSTPRAGSALRGRLVCLCVCVRECACCWGSDGGVVLVWLWGVCCLVS